MRFWYGTLISTPPAAAYSTRQPPHGESRIRVQLSAAHEKEHLDKAIEAFKKIGEKYGILGLKKQQVIDKYGM